jgi:dTDP-4-dehydrorhamnose reductase
MVQNEGENLYKHPGGHIASNESIEAGLKRELFAKKINVLTTQYLANEAKAKSIRFIHISTFGCWA